MEWARINRGTKKWAIGRVLEGFQRMTNGLRQRTELMVFIRHGGEVLLPEGCFRGGQRLPPFGPPTSCNSAEISLLQGYEILDELRRRRGDQHWLPLGVREGKAFEPQENRLGTIAQLGLKRRWRH